MGIKQHVTTPTHRSGHILDLITTSVGDSLVTDVSSEPPTLSDYGLVLCVLNVETAKLSLSTIQFRKLKNINKRGTAADLAAHFRQPDSSTSFEDLNRVVTDVLNPACAFGEAQDQTARTKALIR